mgnify:CR=1 FL=1
MRLAEVARAFGLSSRGLARAAARMEEKLARNAPATRRYQAVKEAILSTGKTSI